MKITKRKLRRIIREEKQRILTEGSYIHDIFSQAASALENRDTGTLEGLVSKISELMMDRQEKRSFRAALEAMLGAAYELEEQEEY